MAQVQFALSLVAHFLLSTLVGVGLYFGVVYAWLTQEGY